MKIIQPLETFVLGGKVHTIKDLEAREIFNGERRRLIEIKLKNSAVLSKHKADEPITVLCLAGKGIFRAGQNLEDEFPLEAGSLITLEAGILHEAKAEPELHLLVSRFKEN